MPNARRVAWRTPISAGIEPTLEGFCVRRIPGRLAHVNIFGCSIFGSVSGSSTATCVTISKVALPELLKR